MPTRSRQLSQGGDREARQKGSLENHQTLKMGVKSLPRTQAGRIEARYRPECHQQALPKEVHENGDPKLVALHCEAMRPLGVVRPERRFQRASHTPQGQRGVHGTLKWATVTAMRAPYGVIAKPFRILRANGRVRQQAAGFRVDNRGRKKQVREKVDFPATATDGTKITTIRGRLRHLHKVLHYGHEAQRSDVSPLERPWSADPPGEGLPHSHTGGGPPGNDDRHEVELVPRPQDKT